MTNSKPPLMNLEALKAAIEAGVYSEAEMVRLPAFGGFAPAFTSGVFSWDVSRLLVQDRTGWRIVPRGSSPEAVCQTIRASLSHCEQESRAACHDHSSDWHPSEADCDFVVDAVKRAHGRMPTRSEWSDAAPELKWVGNKHYEG